ncbi:MAG: bile acid:sodium symporter [Alphaproteobacteria bacterium]|nr:bile acid:sodium symporter [Alphaproteobacteria bacterium]
MPIARFVPRIDRFLVWLTLAVVIASLLPARSAVGDLFWLLSKIAIVLLFFLHGAKLSREAILRGLGNWPLHLATLGITFALFPGLGLASAWLAGGWIDPLIVSGLLFLTLLSSTVQSSIALVSIARGNVAAAVCSASLSNLLGILITPLLVALLMTAGKAQQGFDWQVIRTVTVLLLLPFIVGHLLRSWIGDWIERNKKLLMPVDRGSILLVVYSAFSEAVIGGIWSRVDAPDLAVLLAVSAAILGLAMLAVLGLAWIMRMPREDFIVLLFCGSQKSLVTGVPMAGALFAPAQVGIVVLPLMIYHQLQLFVHAWIAARLANEAPEAT